MKRAFLVLGPESAGNKLVTRLLRDAGCVGEEGHGQFFDEIVGQPDPFESCTATNIVYRRSLPFYPITNPFPSHRQWPDLDRILYRLNKYGYSAHVITMMRTNFCHVRSSVLGHNHLFEITGNDAVLTPEIKKIAFDKSERNAFEAMRRIGTFVLENDLPAKIITYESLVHNFDAFRGSMREWGLEIKPTFLSDRNAKYLFPGYSDEVYRQQQAAKEFQDLPT